MASLVPPFPFLVRRCLSDQRGAAAVEFALLTPVLTVLMFGTVDLGSLAYQSMQVEAAASAGAAYAIHSGWNASAIASAVTSATSLTVAASPSPSVVLACVTNGVLVTTQTLTCPSGGAAGSYVVVNAQATFTPIIDWAAFSLPSTLSAQAMVRIN